MHCDDCKKEATSLITLNPEGGYGRHAYRVCDECLPSYKQSLAERFGEAEEKPMDMTLEDALIVKTFLNDWHARRPPVYGDEDRNFDHDALVMLHRKADAALAKRCHQLFTEQVRLLRD